MENDLTTETELQPDVADNPEDNKAEQVVEPTTEDAYNEAWDNIDVNDTSILEETETATTEESVESDEQVEVAEEASNAFMDSNPVLKYKGKDIPIDNPDELLKLAQKGFSYESEMANLKPMKKTLNTIEGVPADVLQAVADLNSGKQEAIDFLKDRYNISDESDNFFDGETETKQEYKPEIPVDDPVKEYWDSYSASDTTNAAAVSEVYGQLDESFQNEIYQPDVFQSFVQSVTTGEFDTVYPLAIKEKSLNPAISWIQAYGAAAQKVNVQNTNRNDTPPTSVAPVKASAADNRNITGEDADRVWNDDEYFKELDRQIFES